MIPDKAVEAAADALHADNCPEDMHDCVCSDWTREAEIALEAAAPIIRAQIAEEVRPLTPSDEEWQANIKAYQKARGDSDVPTDWDFAFWDAGYKAAIRKAAQIAERSGQ